MHGLQDHIDNSVVRIEKPGEKESNDHAGNRPRQQDQCPHTFLEPEFFVQQKRKPKPDQEGKRQCQKCKQHGPAKGIPKISIGT